MTGSVAKLGEYTVTYSLPMFAAGALKIAEHVVVCPPNLVVGHAAKFLEHVVLSPPPPPPVPVAFSAIFYPQPGRVR